METREERARKRLLQRKAYSVREVADMLGISTDTVYKRVKTGVIPYKRLGNKIIIPALLFDDWLNRQDSHDIDEATEKTAVDKL